MVSKPTQRRGAARYARLPLRSEGETLVRPRLFAKGALLGIVQVRGPAVNEAALLD